MHNDDRVHHEDLVSGSGAPGNFFGGTVPPARALAGQPATDALRLQQLEPCMSGPVLYEEGQQKKCLARISAQHDGNGQLGSTVETHPTGGSSVMASQPCPRQQKAESHLLSC